MKKIITLLLCEKVDGETEAAYEETELLQSDIKNGVKQAKGKYTAIIDGDFVFADMPEFLGALNEASADIIAFDGGYCFKTAILKGLSLQYTGDRYAVEIFAAFNSKTIKKVDIKPFSFSGVHTAYSESVEEWLSVALEEFKKSKSKLPKEVYSFAFDMICSRLVTFYMGAMLAIRGGEIKPEKLVEFDGKLKDNIVLYLALEKRFSADDLKKLREKNFKIGFFTAGKFKKILGV